jgi:protein SCO1
MKLVFPLVLLCLTLTAAAPAGQEPPRKPAENDAAQKYFGDTPLVDQDGRTLRFYSDLIKGKVIVINTFCSACTSTTPRLMENMRKIRAAMAADRGRNVLLLSITVDPLTDTPARLKEYAARFQTGPGWHIVTGSKEGVETVLAKIGQRTDAREAHSTVVIVGNSLTGLWKKADGLATAEDLIKVVDSVVQDKGGLVQRPVQ